MYALRYDTPIDAVERYSLSIFLAAPTVRGHQQYLQPSWRVAAADLFREKGFDGALIIPEFGDITESDKDRMDIPLWEYEGLKTADCIMFWVPRTRELIGLTTNFELGYWMKDREKLVYGRPPHAYRTDYPDILWKKDYKERGIGDPTIYNTLEDTIDAAIKVATRVKTQKGSVA